MTPSGEKTRKRPRLGLVLLVGTLAVVGAVAALLTIIDDESAGPERGVTLGQVIADPSAYQGATVTVSGDVAEVNRNPRAFAIGDDVGEPALVLPQPGKPVAEWPRPDDVASITGTVDVFDLRRYADRHRLFAGDEFLEAFDGEAVIIPRRIDILESGVTSPLPGEQE